MNKIGAFIMFDKLIEKKIKNIKKLLKSNLGDQEYLDHPIHCTLFTLNVENWLNIKKKLQNFKFNYLKCETSKFNIFENDPITGGRTLHIEICKNKELTNLQNNIINLIKDERVLDINFYKNLKTNYLKQKYIQYGYPFFGKMWIPHITIASCDIDKNNNFLNNYKNKRIHLSQDIKYIDFYLLDEGGHEKIFSLELTNTE